jgi:predicted CxxxxCH...CXXCH cytochrome family protein
MINKTIIRVLFLTLVLSLIAIRADTLDYPHTGANSITCDFCHFIYGGEPSLLPPWTSHVPQDIDDTQYNTLCWSCHNGDAPFAKTHSSLETDNGYGDWSMECRTCHNPHKQEQFKTYGSVSYLYEGTVSSVTPTTLTKNGAGWTPDQYKGLIVVPNTAKVNYNYQITGNTSDTLTVKGTIDTARVSAGNTFAIVYGKLVKSTIKLGDITTYIGVSTDIPDTDTIVEAGAGWTDNQYQNLEVMPNASYPSYTYTILSNTPDALMVQGPMDLAYVDVGDIFKIVAVKSGDRAVRFFRTTGTNSFADGNSTYDGVCESCHTQTLYHRNDASGNHNHMINANEKCTTCHKHTEGFKGSGCDVCHGYPPIVDTVGGPDGLVNDPGVTGSATAGVHDKHVNTKIYICESCHYNSAGSGPTHNSALNITIGFSLFNGAYLGGIYDGQTTANYDSSEANTTVINTGSMSCNNIYCHGRLPDGTVWGGGKNTVPTWDGAVTCSSCHDSGGSLSDLGYKHRQHTDESRHGFHCEKCHYQTATGSSAIKDQSYHANNVKDVIFSAGGTLDTGTKSCTNTYCHSDARGDAPNVPVKWTDSFSMQCDSCHNGRTDLDTLEMSTNGHERLVSSQGVRKYPCYYCHDATVNTVSNIKDYSKHVNETKDVVFASKWYIAGNPAPSYNHDTMICDNIYCHSDGTTVNPEVRPYPWTDGHTKCNSCHGHPMGNCTDCHIDDGITGWAPGEEWKSAMPMYANTGAGTERANTHERHLLTDYNCNKCHANTIKNGDCTGCHDGGIPPGAMGEADHTDPVYHVNKIKDVAFSGSGTYDQMNKICSNTSCHTNTDPQWGDSVDSLILCLSCHGTTVADIDDFAPFNDTRAKINMVEWEDTGHGRPVASGNYTSGNPPANFPGNPCWYCHDNEVVHNDATNPLRLKKHQQFERRFEKECVYCHMEGVDSECMDCHNSAESIAPQLTDITSPTYSQDHTAYTDGLTSCVTACHSTDAEQHNSGAGLWTTDEKVDIQNQYVMMGVCLICHDDDSNGKCDQCHTGPQYELGYDPGTGHITGTSKATSTHFGYKHYAAYESEGVWRGGKFCWDCHDPHGDSNIYMVQDQIATETDGTFGLPVTKRDVSFTRKMTGLDYVSLSPPYDGICNVCHVEADQHYRFDYGDGHQSGRVCTTCHEHRYSDSHASGESCNLCHQNKPVPRHTGFGLPRDCTKCHEGAVFGRIDIMGQLRSNSHHIQGVEATNRHCYACHWEGTDIGLIDVNYHEGYNYKTYESVKDAAVDLVIWGPGVRPVTYEAGTTAIAYDKGKIGTVDERTEVTKITQMCLSCHSDQNNDTQSFNVVDPDNGDCKTPRQYAWDRTSIGARYSQAGTTTWGKYTGVADAAEKNITKAFSAHGNAVANQGGWDPATGYDGTTPDSRNGSQNVQCYDCHNSHGSKAEGITSSYMTFNNTYNGANLKETQAGKGGYMMTYKASANPDPFSVNPYNDGAGQCFDCHQTQTAGSKPWGYESTFGATESIMGYKDTSYFGPGTKGSTARFAYRASKATILGGHLNASSDLDGLDGVPGTGDEALMPINGLCTPCHDPHGISPSLGDDQQYAVPLLKGTWMTSPYKEDAPRDGALTGAVGGKSIDRNPITTPYVYIDQNTFGGSTRISEDDSRFAGLCMRCHPKDNLTDGTAQNQPWKSLDRLHETVNGWGNNVKHSYTCSKCHQPHNSGLPRLLQTNCLNFSHRGRVASGGEAGFGSRGSFPMGRNNKNVNCHPTGSWPDNSWNNVTPW